MSKGFSLFQRYGCWNKNRGIPKSWILIGFSIINHPFWGTPIFGNTHIFANINLNSWGRNELQWDWFFVGLRPNWFCLWQRQKDCLLYPRLSFAEMFWITYWMECWNIHCKCRPIWHMYEMIFLTVSYQLLDLSFGKRLHLSNEKQNKKAVSKKSLKWAPQKLIPVHQKSLLKGSSFPNALFQGKKFVRFPGLRQLFKQKNYSGSQALSLVPSVWIRFGTTEAGFHHPL